MAGCGTAALTALYTGRARPRRAPRKVAAVEAAAAAAAGYGKPGTERAGGKSRGFVTVATTTK